MPTTPTGNISQTFTLLRDTIAASSSWQSKIDAATDSEAAEHIHLFALDTTSHAIEVMPRMVIHPTGRTEADAGVGAGAISGGIPSGIIPVTVLDTFDLAESFEDNGLNFLNWLAPVIDEIYENAQGGSGSYLFLSRKPELVEADGGLVEFPAEDEQSEDQLMICTFEAHWGLES